MFKTRGAFSVFYRSTGCSAVFVSNRVYSWRNAANKTSGENTTVSQPVTSALWACVCQCVCVCVCVSTIKQVFMGYSETFPLTVHLDLQRAALLSHVVAGCAFIDSCAVLGQVPQRHNLWVFKICGTIRDQRGNMAQICSYSELDQLWVSSLKKQLDVSHGGVGFFRHRGSWDSPMRASGGSLPTYLPLSSSLSHL